MSKCLCGSDCVEAIVFRKEYDVALIFSRS